MMTSFTTGDAQECNTLMYNLSTSAYRKELSEKEREIKEFESSTTDLEERERAAQRQLLQNRGNFERYEYRYICTYLHTRISQTE